MTKFWEATASSLSQRLFAAGGSALVFWVWVFTVWSIRRGGWSYMRDSVQPVFAQQDIAPLLALVVAVVVVVWTSSLIVDRVTLAVLRLLEGYWPRIANPLRRKLVAHWQKKVDAIGVLPAGDLASPVRLSTARTQMWRFPTGEDVMPTRIGNIIRGGERRPAYWYGLDAIVVWPQLWLVLPEQVRADLTVARQQLDRSVAGFVWAVIACGLGFEWWPAVIPGILVALAIWRWWIPATAQDYATLISAVFDTHRFDLYDTLHYPRPTRPAQEQAAGEALTRSLWSDLSSAPAAKYTAASAKTDRSR